MLRRVEGDGAVEYVEAYFKKKLALRRWKKRTQMESCVRGGGGGLLGNGRSEQLEILATDTRVKLVYDIPSASPTTFLSNGRRIIIQRAGT